MAPGPTRRSETLPRRALITGSWVLRDVGGARQPGPPRPVVFHPLGCYNSSPRGGIAKWLRQRFAKPSSPVRIRVPPPFFLSVRLPFPHDISRPGLTVFVSLAEERKRSSRGSSPVRIRVPPPFFLSVRLPFPHDISRPGLTVFVSLAEERKRSSYLLRRGAQALLSRVLPGSNPGAASLFSSRSTPPPSRLLFPGADGFRLSGRGAQALLLPPSQRSASAPLAGPPRFESGCRLPFSFPFDSPSLTTTLPRG